jgi:hypothetical protein
MSLYPVPVLARLCRVQVTNARHSDAATQKTPKNVLADRLICILQGLRYRGTLRPVATVADLENCAIRICSTKGCCAKEVSVAIGEQAAERTVTAGAIAHEAASQPDSKKLKTHSEKIQFIRI